MAVVCVHDAPEAVTAEWPSAGVALPEVMREGIMRHGSLEYQVGMTAPEFAELLREQLLRHHVLVVSNVDPTVEQRQFWDEVSERAGEVVNLAERPSGDKTGEKWMEIRYDPDIKNAYRHANIAQPMHTDGSYLANAPDVVFFYCLRQAPSGGETTFLDGPELLELLERLDPALLADLRATPITFSKAGDRKVRPVVSEDEVGPVLNWNYHCVDPGERPDVKDLAERYHAFLQRHVVAEGRAMPVLLRPGQAVFFHDERLIHGRNAFEATQRNDRFFWKTGFKFVR